MSGECCKSGFRWDGSPTGTETVLAGRKSYMTGSNAKAAVLIVHDIFGWTLTNTRMLADHYAEEANVTVYIPDFFAGELVEPETMENPHKRAAFDLDGFLARHSKDVRRPEIFGCANALKQDLGFEKVGAIGFCYGGWAVLQLAAKGNNLVDFVSAVHPSMVEQFEIDAVAVPTQFIVSEFDGMFTEEFKRHALAVLPTLGVDYDYRYFAGLVHGFATRANLSEPKERAGLERAKDAASAWMRQNLL